jgi:chromosome segregation ATPase
MSILSSGKKRLQSAPKDPVGIAKLIRKGLEEEIEEEQALLDALDKDEEKLEQIEQDIERIEKEDEAEERTIESIQNDINEFHQIVQDDLEKLQKASQRENPEIDEKILTLEKKVEEELEEDIKSIFSKIESLREAMQEEVPQTQQDEENLVQELNELRAGIEAIQKLKDDIEKASKMEQALTQHAQDHGNDELLGILERDDQELRTAEEYYNDIESREEQLEQIMEKAEPVLEKDIKVEKEEITNLKNDIKGTEGLKSDVKKLANVINQDIHLGDKSAGNLIQGLSKIEDQIGKIEGELETLEQQKEEEVQEESNVANRVKQGLGDIRGRLGR